MFSAFLFHHTMVTIAATGQAMVKETYGCSWCSRLNVQLFRL